MIKGVDHIGVAVESIDEMLTFLEETFGASELDRKDYPEMQQISSIVNLKGNHFELMQPTGPDGPIGKVMKTGGGLHQNSILCDDLEGLVKDLEDRGIKIIGKMFDGPDRAAFIHPKNAKGLLIELTDTGTGSIEKDG